MASVIFSVQPLKTTPEQFHERVKELNDKKSRSNISSTLPQLSGQRIKQSVIGPSHFAFLLEDGTVCRVPFNVNADKVDFTSKESNEEEISSPGTRASASALVHMSGSTPARAEQLIAVTSQELSSLSGHVARWTNPRSVTVSTVGSGSRLPQRGRMRVARSRGRAGWIGSRLVIPASAVPEELVSQAQVVLQGKSRNIIIRELQRTNLDVNLAVNNLLSRDDDDPDDQEDGTDSYVPGDDLISIFESGIPGEDPSFVVDPEGIFSDDFMYGSSLSRSGSRTGTRNALGNENRESSDRERERESENSRTSERWWGTLAMTPDSKTGTKTRPSLPMRPANSVEPIKIGGNVEWWVPEGDGPTHFSQIGSLYSELVAVSTDGYLHQWKWDFLFPTQTSKKHSHPRVTDMNLSDEKIVSLAACNVRATVLTESGKVATWLDETLSAVAGKLEHAAQTFTEFKGLQVINLQVCDLYSCVQLANGSVYWWGVFPFEQRRKLLDKVKQKAKKSAISGSGLIQAGTQVCLRSCPLYYPGAIGFITVSGEPKVGELMEAAWTINEKCFFRVCKNGIKDLKVERTKQEDKEFHTLTEPHKKRKRTGESSDDNDCEEEWNLKDVIFVEDVRNVTVGKVLKVDGAYALVSLASKDPGEEGLGGHEGLNVLLKDCRLVRKDELQIVKWTSPPKMPECFQRTPKQLMIPSSSKVLTFALDTRGVHALLKNVSGLRYVDFSLASGRCEPGGNIASAPSFFLSSVGTPKLYSSGVDSVVLLEDGNGCVFPLIKDNVNGIKDPIWLGLPPIATLCMTTKTVQDADGSKSQAVVAGFVLKEQRLMQAILDSSIEEMRDCLNQLEGNQDLMDSVMREKRDGNRNILHACVLICQPTSAKAKPAEVTPKPADGDSASMNYSNNFTKALEIFRRAQELDESGIPEDAIPISSWPADTPMDCTTTDGTKEPQTSRWIPVGEKSDGLSCLKLLLSNPVSARYLLELMLERDVYGCTPFMAAIRGRAYPAAVELIDAAHKLSVGPSGFNQDLYMSMLCSPNSECDLSPLHMLCCNDTCSFTWTGTKHINQDIFECRTCGLVGSLCCCTECARVCHVGHDCKLKKTSPTAYCDCWEKCSCKALIPGDQSCRFELLRRLVKETDLVSKTNDKGEHLLLFLAQTAARQTTEQNQYNPTRTSEPSRPRSSGARMSGQGVKNGASLPEHDLEPPKFAKSALQFLLKDWEAVKSMILTGSRFEGKKKRIVQTEHSLASLLRSSMLSEEEQERLLNSQEGTSRLDCFTHCLLVKCSAEYMETLLRTLGKALEDREEGKSSESMEVARRFVRSVCRVCVVLAACMGPVSGKRKGVQAFTPAILKCRRVFASLNFLAVKELAEIADSIFAPVRLGVAYPTVPFSLATLYSDTCQASEELFSVPPFPLREHDDHHTSNAQVRFQERERQEVSAPGHRPGGAEEMEMDRNSESRSSTVRIESQDEQTDNEVAATESDMELDLLAESDSDSEDSNNGEVDESQRRVGSSTSGLGGRTNENLTRNNHSQENEGVDYFSGEESIAEGEEEEEEEEEDDENDNHIQTLENRPAGGDNNSAPHALQWAVRNQQSVGTSGGTAHVSGPGLLYIDAVNLRRSATGASASSGMVEGNTMFGTPSALARTFAIVVKELSDVLSLSREALAAPSTCLPLDLGEFERAREFADSLLKPTWDWLWKVMEATESQLRFGASLTRSTHPSHPNHPFHHLHMRSSDRRGRDDATTLRNWNIENRRRRRPGHGAVVSDGNSLRQDFLTYVLSLMRSHENEHSDSLPKLEITSLRHVAYVLDAFIYYLRSSPANKQGQSTLDSLGASKVGDDLQVEVVDMESDRAKKIVDLEDDDEDDLDLADDDLSSDTDLRSSLPRFFKRSDSTLVLGYECTHPFETPVYEALPLADKPHILNPSARRDQLFGFAKQPIQNEMNLDGPLHLSLGMKNASGLPLDEDDAPSTSSLIVSRVSPNFVLGRWRMCLELFGRVFLDDVGAEPWSVLNELGRFDVKEAKFRREMEKLRNGHQKDLFLESLDRDRGLLILQSLRQLNAQFGRKSSSAPLNVHRLKVSFRDEPGEGSGVVRSFYTAIGEAFLSEERLPALDNIFTGNRDEGQVGLMLLAGLTQRLRARWRDRERELRRNHGGPSGSGTVNSNDQPPARLRRERERAKQLERDSWQRLSAEAKPFVFEQDPVAEASDNEDIDEPLPMHKRVLGRRLYSRVHALQPTLASKITGMLLELTPTQLVLMLTHEEVLKERVNEAVSMLNGSSKDRVSPSSNACSQDIDDKEHVDGEDDEDFLDNSPLFFQPGKTGFYSPRPGKNSAERINCFRNVGRIVGLCLLQNELSPLSFNRHVIKCLLGKEISWHDLAFFDATLYESLRQLLQDAKRPDAVEFFRALDLTFRVDLCPEEGGGTVDLIKSRGQEPVTVDNVHDYVRRYAKYRMVKVAKKALKAMRDGLLDVLPAHALDGLTTEDFRLLLNGSGDINVQQLMSYTSFSDETGGDSQDKLAKFKKWFWSIVENMTPKQKQDLVYFWTSSPAMPASAEGFQPMPSVAVKPANDHQLPTANTCISRLYIPLYSSKSILKAKVLMAIRTKTFGFV